MDPKVQKALADYRTAVSQLLTEMSELNQDIFQKKPSPVQWSLAQVCSHLLEVEQMSLAYCQKKIQAGDSIPNTSWLTGVKMFVYLRGLRTNLRFKAPKTISNPVNTRNVEATKADWEATSRELNRFLEDYPDKYLQKAIYRNPVIGRISILQMLQFLLGHFQHHLYQVEKTKQLVAGS